MDSITCHVQRVLYPKPGQESEWKILSTDVGICKGSIQWMPPEGQRLRLDGEWKPSERYGNREFSFYHAFLDMPKNPRALLHYVCTRTKGLGLAKEEEIWDWYDDTFQDDLDLSLIQGLSMEVRREWAKTIEAVKTEKVKTETISWLLHIGCTMNMANSAWEEWEKSTMGTVQSNPYELTSIPGIGFRRVDDKIRESFGITDEDPRRYDAAVLYVMREKSGGDTMLAEEKVKHEVAELGMKDVDSSIERLQEQRTLVGISDSEQYTSLANDYGNEGAIFQRIWQCN